MKQISLALALLFIINGSNAQTFYYKGEWTTINKSSFFTGFLKLDIKKDGSAMAEFVWTYWAIDSLKQDLIDMYNGKKGKSGIEYAEGSFMSATNDFELTGKTLDDPNVILGNDVYHLKLSESKDVLYGSTETEGTNEGIFFAIKLNNKKGEKEFLAAKAKVKE